MSFGVLRHLIGLFKVESGELNPEEVPKLVSFVLCWFAGFIFIETKFHVVQADSETAMDLKVTLNSWSYCLHLLNIRIVMYYTTLGFMWCSVLTRTIDKHSSDKLHPSLASEVKQPTIILIMLNKNFLILT